MNRHNYSFFGNNTGLIFQSAAKTDPHIFFQVIKKKPNNSWEKPSQGEGKVIKFSLEEIIMILKLLDKKISNWNSYHTFKELNTQISLYWSQKDDTELFMKLGDYFKKLSEPQAELLKMLLEHVLEEKIRFATGSQKVSENESYKQKRTSKSKNNRQESPKPPPSYHLKPKETNPQYKEPIPHQRLQKTNTNRITAEQKETLRIEDITEIEGFQKGETEKALLIVFGDKEVWIPKSTIHAQSPQGESDIFQIDSWVLKKNQVFS